MIKSFFTRFCLSLGTILLLNACSQTYNGPWDGPTAQGPTTAITATAQDIKPVKVAFIAPLTGKGSDVGQALLNAAQLALFDIGAQNFNLITRDTKGTPVGAQIATQEAITSGAELILGPLFSESVRYAASAASPYNVNVIGFTTDQHAVSANSFAMGFLPQTQVKSILGYAVTQGKQRFSIVVPNGQYGDIVRKSVQETLNAYNITGAHFHTVQGQNLELDRLYSNMAAQKSDAILIATDLSTANSVSNFLLAKGLENSHVQRLGLGLWDNTQRAYSSALEQAWYTAPSPQQRDRFTRMYENSYGATPPRIASMGYDAAALAISLHKRGSSYTKESLTMPNGFYGLDGVFRFQQNGLVERGLAIMEFTNGRTMVKRAAPKGF